MPQSPHIRKHGACIYLLSHMTFPWLAALWGSMLTDSHQQTQRLLEGTFNYLLCIFSELLKYREGSFQQ